MRNASNIPELNVKQNMDEVISLSTMVFKQYPGLHEILHGGFI